MDGAMSMDPKPRPEMVNGSKVMNDQGEAMEGVAHGGSGAIEQPNASEQPGVSGGHGGNGEAAGGGDAMEIDSRGNARGQTQDQIRRQEHKIHETVRGLWNKR